MDESSDEDDIKEYFQDPISFGVYEHPVLLVPTGQVYSYATIKQYVMSRPDPVRTLICPSTNQSLADVHLVPVKRLEQAIADTVQGSSLGQLAQSLRLEDCSKELQERAHVIMRRNDGAALNTALFGLATLASASRRGQERLDSQGTSERDVSTVLSCLLDDLVWVVRNSQTGYARSSAALCLSYITAQEDLRWLCAIGCAPFVHLVAHRGVSRRGDEEFCSALAALGCVTLYAWQVSHFWTFNVLLRGGIAGRLADFVAMWANGIVRPAGEVPSALQHALRTALMILESLLTFAPMFDEQWHVQALKTTLREHGLAQAVIYMARDAKHSRHVRNGAARLALKCLDPFWALDAVTDGWAQTQHAPASMAELRRVSTASDAWLRGASDLPGFGLPRPTRFKLCLQAANRRVPELVARAFTDWQTCVQGVLLDGCEDPRQADVIRGAPLLPCVSRVRHLSKNAAHAPTTAIHDMQQHAATSSVSFLCSRNGATLESVHTALEEASRNSMVGDPFEDLLCQLGAPATIDVMTMALVDFLQQRTDPRATAEHLAAWKPVEKQLAAALIRPQCGEAADCAEEGSAVLLVRTLDRCLGSDDETLLRSAQHPASLAEGLQKAGNSIQFWAWYLKRAYYLALQLTVRVIDCLMEHEAGHPEDWESMYVVRPLDGWKSPMALLVASQSSDGDGEHDAWTSSKAALRAALQQKEVHVGKLRLHPFLERQPPCMESPAHDPAVPENLPS